jgi:hypothetical protein
MSSRHDLRSRSKPRNRRNANSATSSQDQPFTARAIAQFHREVDAIKHAHDGQKEISRSDVPARFYPSILRSRPSE